MSLSKISPVRGSWICGPYAFSIGEGKVFGAGRALSEREPFVVAFDYKDRSAEQVALCVIATGNELLTVEIVSSGVIEGEARRKLRDACLDMLKSAKPSATVANSVPDLNELVGWKPQ